MHDYEGTFFAHHVFNPLETKAGSVIPRFNQFILLLSSTLQFSKKWGEEIVFRPGTRFLKYRQSLEILTLFRQKSCISLPCRENLFYEPDSKTQSLRTQTSDDWRYVCVRRLKDSEKTYPVQRHVRKCHSGIEYPSEWVSKTTFLMHRM